MDFFTHTTAWIKGEILEALLITAFGLVTLAGGFLFWKLGSVPAAKALLLPLIVTGLIYSAIGISMYISNQKRLTEYEQNYKLDSLSFIKAEKQRVENFQYMYVISKVVATVFFAVTLLLFWFTKSPGLHALGIGLTLFALTGLVVDYFSQERAEIYYQAILKFI